MYRVSFLGGGIGPLATVPPPPRIFVVDIINTRAEIHRCIHRYIHVHTSVNESAKI